MNQKQKAQAEAQEAKTQLAALLKPGDTVYTLLRHVSRSGMLRRISLFVIALDEGGKPYLHSLDYLTTKVLEKKPGKQDGISIGGCGTDMGFALVANLAEAVFGDYTKLKHRWL